ncbi:hypothetical protein AtEden1_Chr5g0084621 [Arabidopsis thaliana]
MLYVGVLKGLSILFSSLCHMYDSSGSLLQAKQRRSILPDPLKPKNYGI